MFEYWLIYCRLETLLEQSFPFISFDELQPISMTILRKMKNIPTKFLKQLSISQQLYQVRYHYIHILNIKELSTRGKAPYLGNQRNEIQRGIVSSITRNM